MAADEAPKAVDTIAEPAAPPAPGPAAAPTPGPADDATRAVAATDGPTGKEKLWQAMVTVASSIVIALLALVVLAFAGFVRLGPDGPTHDGRLVQILILCSIILYGTLVAFLNGGYTRPRAAQRGGNIMYKTKRDLILNGLSVSSTILITLLLVVELMAFLVFLDVLSATGSASIAFAANYMMFAAGTLLFLDMMVLARTNYTPKHELTARNKTIAYAVIPISGLILIVGLLVSTGLLSTGFFAGIDPRQSVYIVTLAVLLQLLCFKLLLRFPAIAAIALRAITTAKKASKDQREEIQKRAFRTYMIGLGFVLVSIFVIGGVATQRITFAEQRSTNMLLLFYAVAGAVILGVLVTRYIQHRYIDQRERRQETGELIAKKRWTADQVRRTLIFAFSGFFATVFLILGLLTLAGRTPFESKYGTDFLIMTFLTGVGPFGFYHAFRIRRQRAMDDKFPDFLRDLAEGQRSGMTLPKALLTAARGRYGALTDDIRMMSAQVEWGISFTEALQRFSKRASTPLIQRAVVLIVEAANAGGNVVDILTAAADDAREIKQIIEERKRQMAIYSIIIYIAFFVFLVVIFVLAAQFLPAFEEAVGGASGEQVGGLTLAAFSKDDFITVFFHGALIQAIGGGLVAGVMTGGSPVDGLKHSFSMTIISWIFFRLLL